MTATWRNLFERGERYDVRLESIRSALADRRGEEGSAGDDSASDEGSTGADSTSDQRSIDGDPASDETADGSAGGEDV